MAGRIRTRRGVRILLALLLPLTASLAAGCTAALSAGHEATASSPAGVSPSAGGESRGEGESAEDWPGTTGWVEPYPTRPSPTWQRTVTRPRVMAGRSGEVVETDTDVAGGLVGIDTRTGQERWTAGSGDGAWCETASDGMHLVCNAGDQVTVLDATDGQTLATIPGNWTFPLVKEWAGRIFVVDDTDRARVPMEVFDLTGARRWTATVSSDWDGDRFATHPDRPDLIAVREEGGSRVFDVESGAVVVTCEGVAWIVAPDRVVCARTDRDLTGYDTVGAQLWRRDAQGTVAPGAGRVYVTDRVSGAVEAVDAEDGGTVWTAPTAKDVRAEFPLVVVLADEACTLQGVDRDSGRTLWTTPIEATSAPGHSPCTLDSPLFDGTRVLVPDRRDATLTALDARTGETRWQIEAGDPDAETQPWLAAQGVLFSVARQGEGYLLTAWRS